MDYYTFKEAFTYGDTSTLYEKKFSYNRWPVLRVTLQLSQVDNIFLMPRPSFPLGDLDNTVSQGQAFFEKITSKTWFYKLPAASFSQ